LRDSDIDNYFNKMEENMTGLMDIIKGRRSILKYEDKEVPDGLLYRVLESLRWCPSWGNTQCWEVIVVKDPAKRMGLQETLPDTNPAREAMVQAPIILVLCGKLQSAGYNKDQASTKFGDWFMFDLGIATQTLCLTAYDLGLGTVITGLFDHDRAKEILRVPDNYELVTILPLGYPSEISGPPERREVREFIHLEEF
jgi:nitroreductase